MSISIDLFLKSKKFVASAPHQYFLNIKASRCMFPLDYSESLANHALGCTCAAPRCGYSSLLPILSCQNRGRSRPSRLQCFVLLDRQRESPSSGDGSPAKQKSQKKKIVLLFPSFSLRPKKTSKMPFTPTVLLKSWRQPPCKTLKLHQANRTPSIRRSMVLKRLPKVL